MTGGSQQLRRYRIARRDGATMATACVLSGIAMTEARLIEAEDLKNPPPDEAYELLSPAPSDGAQTKEPDMGRPKKAAPAAINGEVPKPDFELAVRIYRGDIKPAQGKVGEHAQEMSTAYKEIKKNAHIQPQAAKLAFKLDQMEESKRDDFLRSFRGLLKELRIFMPTDLVDAAQGNGEAGEEVIPTGERPKPKLATVPSAPPPPSDDSDLAGDVSIPDEAA